mmetsp:Transcript_17783/g.35790  ORF Transcript_17783/g.35790 Transcript_17783/m.35790 type:complete len:676 (-) Transcript_17783:125-2152(-)
MNSIQFQSSQHSTGTPVSDLDNSHLSDDSDQPDDNFIGMLQYKDAYHILGLPKSDSPDIAAVLQAYNSLQKQTLSMLSSTAANIDKGAGVNGGAFFICQQNYLELKLQALDQAILELIPEEAAVILKERDKIDGMVEGEEDDIFEDDIHVVDKKPEKETTEDEKKEDYIRDPKAESRPCSKYVKQIPPKVNPPDMSAMISPAPHVKQKESKPNNPLQDAQKSKQQSFQNKGKHASPVHPIETLETIDVPLRPNQNNIKTNQPPNRTSSPQRFQYTLQDGPRSRSKSPSALSSNDSVSGITWDGPVDFTHHKGGLNTEDTSDGELSDVLGPVDKLGKSPSTNRYISASSSTARCKSQTQGSPRSVVDFSPSFEYDNEPKEKTSTRPKSPVKKEDSRFLSHEATEAARMGVLRALSEDDSECLPLDDDDDFHLPGNRGRGQRRKGTNYLNDRDTIVDIKRDDEDRMEFGRSVGLAGASQEKISTRDLNADNSLIESSLSGRSRGASLAEVGSGSGSRGGVAVISKQPSKSGSLSKNGSGSNSLSSGSGRSNSKLARRKSDDDYYESLLNSGMDFAGELCMALRTCWNNILDIDGTNRNNRDDDGDDDDGTYDSRGESTTFTRDTGRSGGDESTAFHTASSFSRGFRDSSPGAAMRKNGLSNVFRNGRDNRFGKKRMV